MSRITRIYVCLATAVVFILIPEVTQAKSDSKPGSDNKSDYQQRQGSASRSASSSGSGAKGQIKPKKGFVALFDGQDISDWIKRGGEATYSVEDGAIVGTSVADTPNTFLCTKRNYANFILELELKVDAGLNSGIQIRSEVQESAMEVMVTNSKGEQKKKKIGAGRVYGYQVEIDPSERAWSGGIYDEARRGWLFNLEGDENKKAREAFKVGEWNKYRIVARGDVIKTWVNGVSAADLKDDMTPEGFIALQVHGIGNKAELVGKQVSWRNLHIRVLK